MSDFSMVIHFQSTMEILIGGTETKIRNFMEWKHEKMVRGFV